MLVWPKTVLLSFFLLSALLVTWMYPQECRADRVWHRGRSIQVVDASSIHTSSPSIYSYSGSRSMSRSKSSTYGTSGTFYRPYNGYANAARNVITPKQNPYFGRSSQNPYFSR